MRLSYPGGDWFFCLVLAVVTMLAYQPAWRGGFLWDDDANIATPELRSLDGLRRIWFEPRTTQQYSRILLLRTADATVIAAAER